MKKHPVRAAKPSTADADGGSPPSDSATSFWRAALRGAFTAVLLAILALALLLAVVPRVMGGEALTVLTGSMAPTYNPGDVVISVPKDDYQIGDVVTFQPESNNPMLVTHRIVAMSSGGTKGDTFTTRGDANDASDDPIVAGQIMGKVVYSIPWMGRLGFGTSNPGLTLFGAALVGYAIYAIGSDIVDKRRRRQDSGSSDSNDEPDARDDSPEAAAPAEDRAFDSSGTDDDKSDVAVTEIESIDESGQGLHTAKAPAE